MTILENIEDLIYEMTSQRKDAEKSIKSLSYQVILHLIKILKYEDTLNYNKHIKDINNWLRKIQKIKIDTKSNKFKSDQYYEFLFIKYINDVNKLDKIINNQLKDYHNLNVLSSNADIYLKLEDVLDKVSKDISKNKFNNIINYLEI